jgi:thiamine transport system permease protein
VGKSDQMKRAFEILLALLFLSPLLILLKHFSLARLPMTSEVLPFITSAALQASLSGALSVALGCIFACGLLSVSNANWRRALEIFFLIPGFVPGIFVVLSVLQIYSVFGIHPMGYLGVVSANVIMSCGLVAVFLERAFRDQVGGFAELSYLEGASRLTTLKTLAPLFWRDIAAMFMAVFIFSFLGFSIPLVLGGLEAATLEVQIYRKIVGEGALPEALAMSVIQFLFIAICAQIVPFKQAGRKATFVNLKFLGSPFFLTTFVLLNLLVLGSPLLRTVSGAIAVFENEFLSVLIFKSSVTTFLIGLVAGSFTFALGALMVYLSPSLFIGRFFLAYSAPSAVLIGFGFYMMGVHQFGFWPQVILLGLILGIFFWPSLYRIGFFGVAANLRGQIEIAQQMGANSKQVFAEVAWPQMRGPVYAMAALAALWAAGDFGISSMLSLGEGSLSLLVKNLISRYRLAEATFVLWILVSVALLAALVFIGAHRVGDRKSSLSV